MTSDLVMPGAVLLTFAVQSAVIQPNTISHPDAFPGRPASLRTGFSTGLGGGEDREIGSPEWRDLF